MPLTISDAPAEAIAIPPSLQAVVSWASTAREATLAVRATLADGRRSGWLPYASFAPGAATSLDGRDHIASIATDTIRAVAPICAVEVSADVALESVIVSTSPPSGEPPGGEHIFDDVALDVPAKSQYHARYPLERGWCAPASLAMLLGYWGDGTTVPAVAGAIYDRAYGGTGNWTFAAAYASLRGFFGAVVHLRGIADAASLLATGIPFAASIAWEEGALPGAPLPASSGHLVVVRGLRGATIVVNDPAHPDLVAGYDREAFERCWLGHGGATFVVAPRERRDAIVAIVNA